MTDYSVCFHVTLAAGRDEFRIPDEGMTYKPVSYTHLYGDNIYQGGTRVEEGTLAVNSDAALGSVVAPLELWDKTTLRLDGNTDMQTRPISIGGGAVSYTHLDVYKRQRMITSCHSNGIDTL